MKSVLEKFDQEVLSQIIGKINLTKIQELLVNSKDNINLANIALAYFGENILDQKRIRIESIKTLPESTIKGLSIKYYGKIFPSIEAAAIQLAAKSWTVNSEFALDLVKNLDISMDYLPKKNNRLNSSEIIEPIGVYYPLFDYQIEIKNKIISNLRNHEPKFVVQMPTGSGKTKTSLEAIISYNNEERILSRGLSFIWIAHTEELCEQAIETLSKIWQLTQKKSLRIVRLYGSYDPSVDELYGSFIFSSYQKLSNKKSENYLKLLSESCRVIIIDEAHKALAKTYRIMLDTITSKDGCLIGLTATPGRSSKEIIPNSDFSQLFNRKIITPTFNQNPIKALREMNILSMIHHITLDSNIQILFPENKYDDDDIDFSQNQLRTLWMNSVRNKIIVDVIEQEIKFKNPCLVFTCSVEHNVILASALNILGIATKFVDSNQRKTHRKAIIDDFKGGEFDVLLNFGVLTTGFDAPRIKTVIITRPTTSIVLYSQMVGRGLRGKKMGGNDICRIIDIKDNYLDFGAIENIYDYFDGYWN